MSHRLRLMPVINHGTRAPMLLLRTNKSVASSRIGQQYRSISAIPQSLVVSPCKQHDIKLAPKGVQVRHSSHSPMGTITNQRKKVTIETLRKMHAKNDPITMITAHDFPSAHVADHAGMDLILVGDSLAMVALGMEDTSEVLLEEMILHCRSVARATKSAFTVGDLPMGSYEISPEQAVESAIRVIKEGRVQSVKLEGGAEMAPTIEKIARAGIPVLAHIGLTPQRQNSLGGFRVQGKTSDGAMKLLVDALAVQQAGAFAVVLEAVPAGVAEDITNRLSIPTIGIGAGNGCSGQVLVQVDMSGNFPPGRFIPKFVKKYGDVWGESMKAIQAYRDEVKTRAYPAPEHTYPMPEIEIKAHNYKLGQVDRDLERSMNMKDLTNAEFAALSQEQRTDFWSKYKVEIARRFREGSLKLSEDSSRY